MGGCSLAITMVLYMTEALYFRSTTLNFYVIFPCILNCEYLSNCKQTLGLGFGKPCASTSFEGGEGEVGTLLHFVICQSKNARKGMERGKEEASGTN